jgi:hypothetical protein
VLCGVVESVEPEKHAEAHQREGRGKTHHDEDHDEHEHRESERRIAHVYGLPWP